MIRKAFTAVLIGSALMAGGCTTLSSNPPAPNQVAYTLTNSAFKTVNSSLFELFTSTRQLLTNIGVQQYRSASNTEECSFEFVYQNLTYKVQMDFVTINQTKVTVAAVSNVVFKNKQAATLMLNEIERSSQGL